jgi:nucleotide-binding universal stress UspA family protein
MRKVAVLVDFTEGCKIAVEQAVVLAQHMNAELYSVTIASDETDTKEREKELEDFTFNVTANRVKSHCVVAKGDLMHTTGYVLSHIDPVIVVVGTHGIKGIKQHLFGAHILKLVQSILYPCVVVQENTKVNPEGFKKILFPVGPHKRFHVKTEQTEMLAAIEQSQITVYEIERSHVDPNEMVMKNKRLAKEYFADKGANFTDVIEDSTVISIGYSRQTIQYAGQNKFDLIAVMSDVPADEIYFGRADKENILTNEFGIPVLCCNN